MKNRVKKTEVNIKEFFTNFLKVIRRRDMVMLPGNLAFFFVLAIIPALSLISYGASYLNLSVDFIYDFIASSFSLEIADIILGVKYVNDAGIDFIVTIIVGLYMASNGADAIIISSNAIYNVENKSWIKRRIKALCMTFLIVLLLIFMLVVPVFGDTIINLIKEVNLNDTVTKQIVFIFDLIKGPITWLIIFFFIRIIYVIAPTKVSSRRKRVINYGAIFTTVGFILVTKIYSIYVTNYARYTNLFGGLTNIIVLMFWIYFLSYIFTIGMALNYEKDEENLLKNGNILEDKE